MARDEVDLLKLNGTQVSTYIWVITNAMGFTGTRVFIGGIYDTDLRDRDLEKIFQKYGEIEEVVIKKGFGFVVFAREDDAWNAIQDCHGMYIAEKRVVVRMAHRPGQKNNEGPKDGGGSKKDAAGGKDRNWEIRSEYRLIVKNLSSTLAWQDLKDFMRQTGDVHFADVGCGEKHTGVVDFVTRRGMEEALRKLDGSVLNGRSIRLYMDSTSRSCVTNRESRSRSRSGSSRGAGRSRSPSSESKSRTSSRSKNRGKDFAKKMID